MNASNPLMSLIGVGLLYACSPQDSNQQTVSPSNLSAPVADVNPSDMPDVKLDVSYDSSNRIVKKLIQRINYIHPVNLNDVMMETAIIIEAKSGETDLRDKISQCYSKLTDTEGKVSSASPRISALVDGYFIKEDFTAETLGDITQIGSAVLQNCQQEFMSECPGQCDNYVAAAIVVTSLNKKASAVNEKSIDYDAYVPTEEGPIPNGN